MLNELNTKAKTQSRKNKPTQVKQSISNADLAIRFERTQSKLRQTEMLLSVTQKIAGLNNKDKLIKNTKNMICKKNIQFEREKSK